MRTKNSLINLIAALIGQFVALLISFISRRFFVQILGGDYLGVNGLFTEILTMLSLVELGVGPAIVFSLYKPLAENDTEKLKVLMRLFKKAYTAIGILVFILGAAITPFLQYFVKEMPNIPHIRLIFLLFVANTGISYFFSYKRSLIISDQRRYIDTIYHYICYAVFNILQIVFLVINHNYIVFLCLQILSTFIENVIISMKADRMYPFLKEKTTQKLDSETRTQIVRNTYAMILHKVGGIVVNSTDNLLLSTIVGLASVGLYSNYQLVVNALKKIVNQIFTAMTASIGNLGVTETKERSVEIFGYVFFINFWIYGFCSVTLYSLFNLFIRLWVGENMLFDSFVVFTIVLNFYLLGMRQTVLTFRDAFGIYYQDRIKPLFESLVNLVMSILLAWKIGVAGVFIGTAISTITVDLWVEPYILYKYGFKRSSKPYFVKYVIYTASTLFAGAVTLLTCRVIESSTWLSLIARLGVCVIVPNLIFWILYHRTKEYKYFKKMFLEMMSQIILKFKKAK